MIYELRVYEVVQGKQGELYHIFETVNLPLFKELGFDVLGPWETVVGSNMPSLTYLLRWASLADREQKFSAFYSHPKRQEAVKSGATYVHRVHSSLMKSISFSAWPGA